MVRGHGVLSRHPALGLRICRYSNPLCTRFARSGLGQAENPYFLYAASNIGSLLALFAYPFVAEPFSTLSLQGGIWRSGYYLLIALLALCGSLVFFRREGEAVLSRAQSTEA